MYGQLIARCGAVDRAANVSPGELLPIAESTLIELGGLHAAGTVLASEADPSIETHMMSPEQALGRPVDARSDLWTVTVLLYRALVGVWPFGDSTAEDITTALSRRPHPSPSSVAPRLGTAFDAFFTRALKKDAVDRYQSAEELLRAFAPAVTTQSTSTVSAVAQSTGGPAAQFRAIQAMPAIPPSPTVERKGAGSRVYLLGLVLIVLIGVGVYVLRLPDHHAHEGGEQHVDEEIAVLPITEIRGVNLKGKRELNLPLSQPFILNIWLERCADCMPMFEAWKALSAAGAIPKAPIVNVSAFRPADEGWAENYRVDEQLVWDAGGTLVRPLGVRRFTTFIVRPDGSIAFRGHPDQPGFSDAVAKALKSKAQ